MAPTTDDPPNRLVNVLQRAKDHYGIEPAAVEATGVRSLWRMDLGSAGELVIRVVPGLPDGLAVLGSGETAMVMRLGEEVDGGASGVHG